MTSPVPERMNDWSWSATARSASSRLSTRSFRQSLASSTAARARFPRCSSSLPSKRANSVKASAAVPAKPARIRSWYSLRTFRAPAFTIVCPIETWPSPPRATCPRWRTETMVVARTRTTVRAVPRAGAGVGGVIDLHEPVGPDVRVALRGGEAAVTEELLDHPEVRPRVEQVRRERVPERVRAHPPGNAGRGGAPPHDRVDRARRQPAAAAIHEERATRVPASAEVRLERAGGRAAERDHPLLAPLAEDPHRPGAPVHVVEVEPHELGHAQSCGVQQLEDRDGAGPAIAAHRPRLDQRGRLVDRQERHELLREQ